MTLYVACVRLGGQVAPLSAELLDPVVYLDYQLLQIDSLVKKENSLTRQSLALHDEKNQGPCSTP